MLRNPLHPLQGESAGWQLSVSRAVSIEVDEVPRNAIHSVIFVVFVGGVSGCFLTRADRQDQRAVVMRRSEVSRRNPTLQGGGCNCVRSDEQGDKAEVRSM